MDEFSTGIQKPGGNAGEKSGERSEIEIFDFVNQKPDLTAMDKGLFARSDAGSLPKRTQISGDPGPRYENAWEEIELRDTERRAEEKRRAESGKKRRSGKGGAEAGRNRTSGKGGAEAGRNRTSVKRAAGQRKRRDSAKHRTQKADRMRRERAVRIRIALIAALVLLCILAGLFFSRRKREDTAIPVTVRREQVSFVSIPEAGDGLICRDVLSSGHIHFYEDTDLWG